MTYQKIPLDEQLKKVACNYHIHPEYAPCAIRMWAETPLAAYFGPTEKGRVLCSELMQVLGIPEGKEWEITYGEAAARIPSLDRYLMRAALRMLAIPLADAYAVWKKAWEEAQRNDEDPA